MSEDKATIREFVEENDKLLAVLGIFIGVAAFTVNSQIKLVGEIVAFLFILAALLIWSELFYRFVRPKPPHPRLVFFYVVLSFAFLTTILYWMLEFNNIMRFVLSGIMFEMLSMPLRLRRTNSSKTQEFFMYFATYIVALLFALAMTQSLDRLKSYLLTKQGTTITK